MLLNLVTKAKRELLLVTCVVLSDRCLQSTYMEENSEHSQSIRLLHGVHQCPVLLRVAHYVHLQHHQGLLSHRLSTLGRQSKCC